MNQRPPGYEMINSFPAIVGNMPKLSVITALSAILPFVTVCHFWQFSVIPSDKFPTKIGVENRTVKTSFPDEVYHSELRNAIHFHALAAVMTQGAFCGLRHEEIAPRAGTQQRPFLRLRRA